MHLPPLVSVKDYAHRDMRHDVTICYAKQIQKDWIHNFMSTADKKQDCIKKRNYHVYNQDTTHLFFVFFFVHWFDSATCSQEMGTLDKYVVCIFTSLYYFCLFFFFLVVRSFVKRGWNPDLVLLWLTQHRVQHDAVSRVKACSLHVRIRFHKMLNTDMFLLPYTDIVFSSSPCLR